MKSDVSIAVPKGVATATFPDVAAGGTDVVIDVLVAAVTCAGVELNVTRL